MEQKLKDLLRGVSVAKPQELNGLQLYGLQWEVDPDLTYTTLDEALESGAIEVTEVTAGGSVPEVKVINKGDTLIFIMAGEQLVGAKQNRVVNASMLVPAKDELSVPVSCVERGRWGYRSRHFGKAYGSSHSRLRKMMSKHAYQFYRESGRPSSKQDAIWSEVDRKLKCMGSASPSAALEQAYSDKTEMLEKVVGEARVPEASTGVAFVYRGRIAGVDLFDKPATLQKLLPKLVRAYAIDALEVREEAKPVKRSVLRKWLKVGTKAPSQPFDSPGLGQDIRIESKKVVGACLVVDERPIHMELFPDDTE